MDLTGREYERRFKDTLDRARLIAVQLDHHGNIIYCNDFTCSVLGYEKDEIMGKNWFDLFIPEEKRGEIRETFLRILQSNGAEFGSYINPISTKSGASRIIRWNNITLKDVDGNVIGTSSIGEDITDLVKANERLDKLNRLYSVISSINQTIIHISDKKTLFEDICRICVRIGGFRMAWIGLLDQSTGMVVPYTSNGHVDGYLDGIKISVKGSPEGMGPSGTAMRTMRSSVCNDIENDPRMAPWKDAALKRGYRSSASLPIMLGGKSIGVLNFYSSEKDFFDREEILLLEELTGDLSFALDAMEKEAARVAVERQLKEKMKEMERLNEIMMGREEKIMELKEKIKELSK